MRVTKNSVQFNRKEFESIKKIFGFFNRDFENVKDTFSKQLELNKKIEAEKKEITLKTYQSYFGAENVSVVENGLQIFISSAVDAQVFFRNFYFEILNVNKAICLTQKNTNVSFKQYKTYHLNSFRKYGKNLVKIKCFCSLGGAVFTVKNINESFFN